MQAGRLVAGATARGLRVPAHRRPLPLAGAEVWGRGRTGSELPAAPKGDDPFPSPGAGSGEGAQEPERRPFPALPSGTAPSCSTPALAPRQPRAPGACRLPARKTLSPSPGAPRPRPRAPRADSAGPGQIRTRGARGGRRGQLPGREEHDEVRGALDAVREHVGRVQVLGVRVLPVPAVGRGGPVRRRPRLLGPGAPAPAAGVQQQHQQQQQQRRSRRQGPGPRREEASGARGHHGWLGALSPRRPVTPPRRPPPAPRPGEAPPAPRPARRAPAPRRRLGPRAPGEPG